MKKRRLLLLDISVFIAMVFAVIVYATAEFQSGCENVKDNVLRLHVIANSDSEEDQSLKLKVRDAIIETGSLVFEECSNKEEAAALAEKERAYLTETAEKVIRENGMDYDVALKIGEEYYPTRSYESVTLPAGEYLSLRVVIGEGAGKNWWCVVFPPMCVSAATESEVMSEVLDEEGMNVIESEPRYEVRFKIVEWYERAKRWVYK